MIGYPTWLPGAIKASDWLKFLMIFFSDTTWRMELKIVKNDHCKKKIIKNLSQSEAFMAPVSHVG
jgi:hypothetical protein